MENPVEFTPYSEIKFGSHDCDYLSQLDHYRRAFGSAVRVKVLKLAKEERTGDSQHSLEPSPLEGRSAPNAEEKHRILSKGRPESPREKQNKRIIAQLLEWDPEEDELSQIENLFADDAIYDRVGVEILRGRGAIIQMWLKHRPMGPFSKEQMIVRSVDSSGERIFVEQNHQTYREKDGSLVSFIGIMAAFRIRNGQIYEWKDYYAPPYFIDESNS